MHGDTSMPRAQAVTFRTSGTGVYRLNLPYMMNRSMVKIGAQLKYSRAAGTQQAAGPMRYGSVPCFRGKLRDHE